jgi:hypothetical protein
MKIGRLEINFRWHKKNKLDPIWKLWEEFRIYQLQANKLELRVTGLEKAIAMITATLEKLTNGNRKV